PICSFFFSSRRRHTRFSRDWSSDVCSSDLIGDRNQSIYSFRGADPHAFEHFLENPNTIELPLSVSYRCAKSIVREARLIYKDVEIGRASCRERVKMWVEAE